MAVLSTSGFQDHLNNNAKCLPLDSEKQRSVMSSRCLLNVQYLLIPLRLLYTSNPFLPYTDRQAQCLEADDEHAQERLPFG